jgi:hypothetical protein
MPNTVERPSPVPLPRGLVVKNGRTHAVARVADCNQYVRPGRDAQVLVGVLAAERGVARLDREPAPLQHRIAGIDREVHDDLTQLAAVGQHRAQDRTGYYRQIDVLADDPPQHTAGVVQQLPHIDERRLEHLLATEREELLGEGGRSRRSFLDSYDIIPSRGAAVEIGQQKFGIAADSSEDVVEVVRDAAGQLPDRVQLLSVQRLFLCAPPRRDIEKRAHGPAGPAGFVEKRRGVGQQMRDPAVRVDQVVLLAGHGAAGCGRPRHRQIRGSHRSTVAQDSILLLGVRQQRYGTTFPQPYHRDEGIVAVELFAGDIICDGDSDRQYVEQGLEFAHPAAEI